MRAQTSDEPEWQASLRGDGSKFAVLFDRHHGRVYNHAARLVDQRHEAEDVTATAFLELWRRRNDVRLVNGSVLPWLLVTATNTARSAARKSRRHRQFLDRLPQPANAPEAGQGLLDRDIEPGLATAIRELPSSQAAVLSLVELEGFSVAEAAQQLGLSSSAASSRLHRAKSRLRAQLTIKETS